MNPAISIQNLNFKWPKQQHNVLTIDSLEINPKEHCFIKGKSGSGKTTLLNLMAGIFTPQSGTIELLGTDMTKLSIHKKDRFRADHLGMIFQQFNLLPYLSVKQNILLPLQFSDRRAEKEAEADRRVLELMDALQLSDKLAKQPANRLSIGQQQRVAVARAMMGKPEIIIADEPTSALDSDNRDRFIEALFSMADRFDSTLVFVSHDAHLAKHFTRQIDLMDINQAVIS